MAKIEELVISLDDVLDRIYGNKLERGGYLEIVVPAIGMADKVYYQATDELGVGDVVVEKSGDGVIPKYLGRKIVFTSTFADYKDLYTQEKITYVAASKKKAEPKARKLTFYWRLVKKSKK